MSLQQLPNDCSFHLLWRCWWNIWLGHRGFKPTTITELPLMQQWHHSHQFRSNTAQTLKCTHWKKSPPRTAHEHMQGLARCSQWTHHRGCRVYVYFLFLSLGRLFILFLVFFFWFWIVFFLVLFFLRLVPPRGPLVQHTAGTEEQRMQSIYTVNPVSWTITPSAYCKKLATDYWACLPSTHTHTHKKLSSREENGP